MFADSLFKGHCLRTLALVGTVCAPAVAAVNSVAVPGTDVIFLAGRSDVTLAPPGTPPNGYLLQRNSPPGAYAETFPERLTAVSGQTFEFSSTGTIHFSDADIRGGDGETSYASLNPLGGISGYYGPKSCLVGVFLNDDNPANSSPPAWINYSATPTSSSGFSPGLAQVFFIGDGLTGNGTGVAQNFLAPAGATRLYLAYADGFVFHGAPGYYDDNSGALTVTVMSSDVPEPSTLAMVVGGALVIVTRSCRKRVRI
jgi:hypothetical protein